MTNLAQKTLPILSFGLLLTCVSILAAETIYAVKDGQATAAAQLTAPQRWHAGADGALVGGGIGHMLCVKQPFASERLVIDAELALEKLEGTAASLIIGNGNLGLDGGAERLPFFERLDQTGAVSQTLETAFRIIQGEFFHLHIECSDGRLAATADGVPLAEVPFKPDGSVTVALRPHRNTMHIKSFCVTGMPLPVRDTLVAERLNQKLNTVPVVLETVSSQDGGKVTLKSENLPAPGTYSCTIAPENPEGLGKAIPFRAELDNFGQLRIPAEVAQAIYSTSAIKFNLRPARLEVRDANSTLLVSNRLLLSNPLATTDYPQGEVRMTAGQPEFWVDNEPTGTVSGRLDRAYGVPRIQGRAIRQFAEAGIHNHLLIVFPYHFMRMEGKELVIDWDAFLQDLKDDFSRIIAEDPLAYFRLHYELLVSSDWVDVYPDEAVKLDNGVQTLNYGVGKKLQPSYASPTWRRQAGEILAEAVRRLCASPYADRISHWRLLYANCGEWNHWGYHESAFVDYSAPMQQAFGEWLHTKYGTNEALQAAWGRAVDFGSGDLVPSREERLSGGKVFRTGGSEVQSTVDYYAFFQEYAARTIEYFAKIVKEASRGRLLVGSYYGYYWGHLNASPYHCQDSGNYGMKYLLESPWLDFVGGPYPYDNRRNGLETNGLVLSLARHGKIWESEGDMRTHYSGEGNRIYGTTDNVQEDIAIARRDWLLNRSRKATYYFFDFVSDWYRDPPFMENLGKLHRLDEAIRGISDRHPARVAFVVSEESLPHFSNHPARAFQELRNTVQGFNRCWGAPCDILGEADLADTDFSQYRLVIFANAAYVSDETIRLTHERVMRDGRTVLFLHAPGLIGMDNQLDPERSRAFTGIGLKAIPEGTYTEVHFQPGNSPYMKTAPIEFQTVIDDPEATVMATYPDGQVAGAVKRFADYTAIVLCHPAPNAAFMRTLFNQMGIHIYERLNTWNHYFFTGPLVGIYSRQKSHSSLAFPETYEVIADVFTSEVLARNADRVDIEMPDEPATRILFTGSNAEWEQVRNLVK